MSSAYADKKLLQSIMDKMKSKFKIVVTILVSCIYSCANMNVTKVPKMFVSDISSNLNKISSLMFQNYKSNSHIDVSQMENGDLKTMLETYNVQGFEITFKYDSITNSPYTKGYKNPVKSDSLIVFAQYRNLRNSLDSWATCYQIQYFFGSKKPDLRVYRDKKSDISQKINDSLYAYSERYPNR